MFLTAAVSARRILGLQGQSETDIVDVNIVDTQSTQVASYSGRHSWLTRPASIFNFPSSLVTISEALYS